jgi:WD40 repeat protein/SAM-dependent methyltransferase
VESWLDSIVRIASSDPDNTRFGTGFVIHREPNCTFILTCGHVVRAIGGPTMMIADGQSGVLIASGEHVDIDLAIIRVDMRLDREPLLLQAAGTKGMSVTTAGFQHVLGQEYAIRELSGVLEQQVGLESRDRSTRLEAWEVKIRDDATLQPGQSGSPIIDNQNGSAVGILRIKQGQGDRGLAISAQVVHELWPNLPSLFLNETHTKRDNADWAQAPDISRFFGRGQELATLEQWIIEDKCRVVGITGLGGIGKTAVTVALTKGNLGVGNPHPFLAEGIQQAFDGVIWRSLLNAPPVEETLRDLIAFASEQREVTAPLSLELGLASLLAHMESRRCLIILDNVESILQSGEHSAGAYCVGYEGYGDLFKRIGGSAHQSCLVLNSREKPVDIARMEGQDRLIRSLELTGLDEQSAKQFVQEIGTVQGSQRDWTDFVRLYGGNPLSLELAAKHIIEVYFGDLNAFLQSGKSVFEGLHELLDWHLGRLSKLEVQVVFWLAIDRRPVTLNELESNFLDSTAKKQIPSVLQSLQRRLPLQRAAGRFGLQPVLIEHATHQLIEHATNEVLSRSTETLKTYALSKALAGDFVREAQMRVILLPVIDGLKSALGGTAAVERWLREYIREFRRMSDPRPNYGAGNVINLLSCLAPTLRGLDFSDLDIRQAYLQEVALHNVSFANSRLTDCAFTQTFGPISCLALSPNSEMVAATESNGDIHIWRIADLQVVATLSGHINWIFALAFSPDGATLASGGEDKTVRLWDVETGVCLRELREHSNSVWAVAFSPNGKIIATGSEDQTVKVWNLDTGNLVASMSDHTQKVFSLEFSPDGQRLASASADHTIRVWDVVDWSHPVTLTGHEDAVRGVTFSPDGRSLASCSWDRTIKLWNSETGTCVRTFLGHTDSIHSVAFHPGGETLASSGESGAIRIWGVRDGRCLATLQRHVGEVWKIAFSRDGQLLVSGGYDGALRIWETADWICRNTLYGYIDWVQAVAISPDGDTVVGSYGDLSLRVWDMQSGECRKTLRAHTGWTFSVTFSPDGSLMATASDDRTVKVWSAHSWEVKNTLEGHSTWVQAVSFSRDGQVLASASDDRTIKLWDVHSGDCLASLIGHAEGIWSLAFAPVGNLLASGSEDHTVRIWDTESRECVRTLSGHRDRVHGVAFDPAGERLISCSDDKTIRVWDVASGECKQVLEGHSSWVISATFDASGTYVWSGGKDGTLRVWDLRDGECVNVLDGHNGGIWGVASSGARSLVVTACEDGSIRLWEAPEPRLLRVLRPLKPYENTNIFGVSGLTDAQKGALRALGAVEEEVFPMINDSAHSEATKTHDYARFAKDYSELGFDGTYYLAFRDVPDLISEHANGSLALDYGCGTGRSTQFLRNLGLETIGVDISVDMLGKARQLDPVGEYTHIQSGQLPFADETFDIVFSSFVFIEVSSREELSDIVQEMERVLKVGGCIMIVTVPARDFRGDWVSFDYDFPENERDFASGDTVKLRIRGTDVVLYDYYWTDVDYREAFLSAGLSVEQVHLPLGTESDPVPWRDEKRVPFVVVYVLRHLVQSGVSLDSGTSATE